MNNLLKPSLLKHVLLASQQRNVLKLGTNIRYFSDKIRENEERLDNLIPKMSGFAKAFEKQETAVQDEQRSEQEPAQSFAAMLRNSKFIDVRFWFLSSIKIDFTSTQHTVRRPWRQSRDRKHLSRSWRRSLYRFRMEVPLCVFETGEEFWSVCARSESSATSQGSGALHKVFGIRQGFDDTRGRLSLTWTGLDSGQEQMSVKLNNLVK